MNEPIAIDKYAARLLMIAFFLPMKVQGAMVILLCVYFACKVFVSRLPVHRQSVLWALVIGSGFFLYAFSIPLTPVADRHILSMMISNRASLLLLPVIFAIITPAFGGLLMRELKYFVYACIVACIVANVAFIYHFYFSGNVVQHVTHVDYRQFLERFTGIHPTYLGMYLAFAICILLSGYVHVGRVAKIVMLYILLMFLLAVLAKSPLIALGLIFIHYAYQRRHILFRYKWLLGGMLVAVVAVCFFIPFIGQRVGEMLALFGKAKPANVTDNSIYTREMIWRVDTGLIKQYWLTGIGPAHLLRYLDYHYFFYSVTHGYSVDYFDPHNEYFWEWISFGIIGIIVCAAVLIIHFIKAIRGRNYLYVYLLLILSVTFSTESVLSRQQGILFYTVFTSLFFFYKPVSAAKQR